MKKLIVFVSVLLFPMIVFAVPGSPPGGVVQDGNTVKTSSNSPILPGVYTVGTLPTPIPANKGAIAIITDGDDNTDCTTGSGSSLVICQWTGSAWENAGDGQAAGSGDVGSVGDCASGACLDGTSDGGTYVRLYDGDSNYLQIDVGDLSGDVTTNFPLSAGTLQLQPSEGAFANGDKTKLDGIEAAADVTDATNVAAAGALMDSGTDNVDDTHINWGSGAGQVDADDIGDGSTNAIPTLTQETNWDTAYGWGNPAGVYLALTGGTLTNTLITDASDATASGIRLPHGAAPSSPTNGDVWTTTSGLYAYINGGTVGPFVEAAGSTAYNSIGDPTDVGLISFDDGETATYDGANDTETFFTISLNAADLTGDTTALLITAVDNDDANYIPLLIQDDQDGTPDDLFKVDYTGLVTAAGGFATGASDNPTFYLNETDGTDWWWGIDDTGNSIEFRTNTTIGNSVQFELDEDGDGHLTGDIYIIGDDIFATTNTAGYIWVGDDTNYNPVAVSGVITLSSAGVTALVANAVDSDAYVDGSIDPEHVASGVWDFGTSAEADTLTEGGIGVPNVDEIDASSELAAIIDDETGTGSIVFATSPTLVTPILGTPTSGTLTNCTGLPSSGITDGDKGEITNTSGTWTLNDTGVTITSITVGSLLGVDSIDATGAVDMDYGSADVTDHTFVSDGGTVVIDGTIDVPDADDPYISFIPATASDSSWWIGVNHDSEGDDDDILEIRQSATPGTNVRYTINVTGNTRKVKFTPKEVELDGTAPPTLADYGTDGQTNISSLQFDADGGSTGDDIAYISWNVPDGYVTDSARLNIAYTFSTAEDAADEAQFDFTVNAVAAGEALDAAGTDLADQTTVISDASADNGNFHITQYNIEVEDIAVNDFVTIQIAVDESASALANSGTLDVLYLEIEYESTE